MSTTPPQLIVCPFCGWTDFDKIGLKHHLECGSCDQFEDTPTFSDPMDGISESIRKDDLTTANARIAALEAEIEDHTKLSKLYDAAATAYNTLVDAVETLIVCDHISMMRHPQLVDKLHQAMNGLKRTLHICKGASQNASATIPRELADRLSVALERLPLKMVEREDNLDAAEFVDHSHDFMCAMKAGKAALAAYHAHTKEAAK